MRRNGLDLRKTDVKRTGCVGKMTRTRSNCLLILFSDNFLDAALKQGMGTLMVELARDWGGGGGGGGGGS